MAQYQPAYPGTLNDRMNPVPQSGWLTNGGNPNERRWDTKPSFPQAPYLDSVSGGHPYDATAAGPLGIQAPSGWTPPPWDPQAQSGGSGWNPNGNTQAPSWANPAVSNMDPNAMIGWAPSSEADWTAKYGAQPARDTNYQKAWQAYTEAYRKNNW